MSHSTMFRSLFIVLGLALCATAAHAGKNCSDRIGTGLVLTCGGTAEDHPTYGFGLFLDPGSAGNFSAEIPFAGIGALNDSFYTCSCDDKGSAKKPKLNESSSFICTTAPTFAGGSTITVLQGTLNKKGTKVSKGRGHITTYGLVEPNFVESFLFTCNDDPAV